jgi:acetyltransferase-like isoleucine patch superfamily enzyme
MPSVDRIRRLLQGEGLALTLLRAPAWLERRAVSWLVGRRLGAPGLKLEADAKIEGLDHITIGRNFQAGRSLWLEAVTTHGGRSYQPRLVIGDDVAVNDRVHIAATTSVTIGDHVLMASRVYVSDHHHGVYHGAAQSDPDEPPTLRPLTTGKPVVIEENVFIGEGVAVLAGVTIGRGSLIGANAVVTRDVPPYSMAVGAPARVVKAWSPESKTWVAAPTARPRPPSRRKL